MKKRAKKRVIRRRRNYAIEGLSRRMNGTIAVLQRITELSVNDVNARTGVAIATLQGQVASLAKQVEDLRLFIQDRRPQ